MTLTILILGVMAAEIDKYTEKAGLANSFETRYKSTKSRLEMH